MKKILVLFSCSFLSFGLSSQVMTDAIKINDTRRINDTPDFNKASMRIDFKYRSTIGVPGSGECSSNMTISPWYDSSGGLHHQLNFNDGGIFYRTGVFDSGIQNGWNKIVTESSDGYLYASSDIILPANKQISLSPLDQFAYDGRTMSHYALQWGYDSWNRGGPTFWLSGWGGMKFFTGGQTRFAINSDGNIGIGTEAPQAKLDVRGTISAEEVRVQVLNGADHVFKNDYGLRPLSEVEAFVKENKHLPEIQSEKQMQDEGLNMNEFQIKLLQKIEELTLYVIKQDKLIKKLQDRFDSKE